MNGLLPDGYYFTIHITPEPDFSYVSTVNTMNSYVRSSLCSILANLQQQSLVVRHRQVSIVIVNVFIFLVLIEQIIKLFVWSIMILFIVIIKSIRAEDYATPSTCVKLTCTYDRVLQNRAKKQTRR